MKRQEAFFAFFNWCEYFNFKRKIFANCSNRLLYKNSSYNVL